MTNLQKAYTEAKSINVRINQLEIEIEGLKEAATDAETHLFLALKDAEMIEMVEKAEKGDPEAIQYILTEHDCKGEGCQTCAKYLPEGDAK